MRHVIEIAVGMRIVELSMFAELLPVVSPLHAVEHHVPLARCANTGLTEMIDAYGVVTGRLPVFVPRVLLAPLPAVAAPTLYTRAGDWPGVLALVLALALAVVRWRPWARRGDGER